MHQQIGFKQRGDTVRTSEGATLTEHQLKANPVSRLQLFAKADYLGGLITLTASCTRDSR
jgi:hypothetical protein